MTETTASSLYLTELRSLCQGCKSSMRKGMSFQQGYVGPGADEHRGRTGVIYIELCAEMKETINETRVLQ